jgi:hypothetical protein
MFCQASGTASSPRNKEIGVERPYTNIAVISLIAGLIIVGAGLFLHYYKGVDLAQKWMWVIVGGGALPICFSVWAALHTREPGPVRGSEQETAQMKVKHRPVMSEEDFQLNAALLLQIRGVLASSNPTLAAIQAILNGVNADESLFRAVGEDAIRFFSKKEISQPELEIATFFVRKLKSVEPYWISDAFLQPFLNNIASTATKEALASLCLEFPNTHVLMEILPFLGDPALKTIADKVLKQLDSICVLEVLNDKKKPLYARGGFVYTYYKQRPDSTDMMRGYLILYCASSDQNVAEVETLIKQGALLYVIDSHSGESAFDRACVAPKIMAALLAAPNGLAEARASSGLKTACKIQNKEVIALLLKAGVKPNTEHIMQICQSVLGSRQSRHFNDQEKECLQLLLNFSEKWRKDLYLAEIDRVAANNPQFTQVVMTNKDYVKEKINKYFKN